MLKRRIPIDNNMSSMHFLLTTIPTIIFLIPYYDVNGQKLERRVIWVRFGRLTEFRRQRKTEWLVVKNLANFCFTSLQVKTNMFPWLWSIHIRRGKIDGTTPFTTWFMEIQSSPARSKLWGTRFVMQKEKKTGQPVWTAEKDCRIYFNRSAVN